MTPGLWLVDQLPNPDFDLVKACAEAVTPGDTPADLYEMAIEKIAGSDLGGALSKIELLDFEDLVSCLVCIFTNVCFLFQGGASPMARDSSSVIADFGGRLPLLRICKRFPIT